MWKECSRNKCSCLEVVSLKNGNEQAIGNGYRQHFWGQPVFLASGDGFNTLCLTVQLISWICIFFVQGSFVVKTVTFCS